jgi:hypothetical protein
VENPPSVRASATNEGRFQARSRCKEQEEARIKKYNISRRTVRIWPIEGISDEELFNAVLDFFANALLLTTEQIAGLQVEDIERVRTPPRSKAHSEVRITLGLPESRDFVFSQGKMLADYVKEDGSPTAGFKMDIPDFLAADFASLEDLSFKLRRLHGKETRRYIRYDDSEYSLYLEVRLPRSTDWLRISPSMARDMRAKYDTKSLIRAGNLLEEEQKNPWSRPPPSSSLASYGGRHPRLTLPLTNVNSIPLGHRGKTNERTQPRPSSTSSILTTSSPVALGSGTGRRQTWNPTT